MLVELLFVYGVGLRQRFVSVCVSENFKRVYFTVVKKFVAHRNAERHYAEPVFIFYFLARVASAVKRNRNLHFILSPIRWALPVFTVVLYLFTRIISNYYGQFSLYD